MLWACLLPSDLPPDEPPRTEALRGLATWCLQFTPRVATLEPASPQPAVVMEVEHSVRLFGGKRALVQRVREQCPDLGVGQLSWAPTSLAALALARAGLSNGFAKPLAQLFDYASVGLTLRRHPLALLRDQLRRRRFMTAEQLARLPDGRQVAYCGIVTLRQQPETANGTVFVSLEDETGVVQVIVWKSLRDEQRHELLHSRLMAVYGHWRREGDVCSLIARRLEDLTAMLGRLAGAVESRDFR